MIMATMSAALSRLPNTLQLNEAQEETLIELMLDHRPVTTPVPRPNAL
ncbi:hypothetical protein SEA_PINEAPPLEPLUTO_29 [Microbacterium phage PineapplePluto]|nr:hypothetical protein SEA_PINEAPPLEPLUTO_29 [Microbacterium phage PineapplePluto]